MEETKKIDLSDRIFKIAAVVVAVALMISVFNAFIGYKTWRGDYPREITINAQGKAYAKPDIAISQFGVSTDGKNTQTVVKENTEKMNAVIEAIKNLDVEDKDIQTTAYNLSPQYDWTETGRIFIGYKLIQQITVKIRNFEKIGDILDSATEKGANEIGNLQFTVDDIEKFRAEARVKAITAAKEKAKNMVEVAGLKLGKITNIYEDYYSSPQPYAYDLAKGIGGGETAGIPQIQSGEMEIIATINLTYRIK
ncbi:MAG: SIMPL domain-containing protein [Patescibacteria group bacterium]